MSDLNNTAEQFAILAAEVDLDLLRDAELLLVGGGNALVNMG